MYVCIYIYCVYSNENTIADLFAQSLNHGCENAACQISVQSILISWFLVFVWHGCCFLFWLVGFLHCMFVQVLKPVSHYFSATHLLQL